MTGSILHEQTYRRVSASHASAREAAWVHRGLAYFVALAVNLALIGVFLFNSPPQYLKPGIAARSEVLTVSIITAAQDAAEASEASVAESPPAEAGPRSALVEREATPAQTTDETQDETEAPPGIPVLGPNAGPRDEPGAALAIVRPGPLEAGPGPTVRSTLRSLSCAQRLGREGPNPGCRNAVPGYAWGPISTRRRWRRWSSKSMHNSPPWPASLAILTPPIGRRGPIGRAMRRPAACPPLTACAIVCRPWFPIRLSAIRRDDPGERPFGECGSAAIDLRSSLRPAGAEPGKSRWPGRPVAGPARLRGDA